jgi:hypothetical protein
MFHSLGQFIFVYITVLDTNKQKTRHKPDTLVRIFAAKPFRQGGPCLMNRLPHGDTNRLVDDAQLLLRHSNMCLGGIRSRQASVKLRSSSK